MKGKLVSFVGFLILLAFFAGNIYLVFKTFPLSCLFALRVPLLGLLILFLLPVLSASSLNVLLGNLFELNSEKRGFATVFLYSTLITTGVTTTYIFRHSNICSKDNLFKIPEDLWSWLVFVLDMLVVIAAITCNFEKIIGALKKAVALVELDKIEVFIMTLASFLILFTSLNDDIPPLYKIIFFVFFVLLLFFKNLYFDFFHDNSVFSEETIPRHKVDAFAALIFSIFNTSYSPNFVEWAEPLLLVIMITFSLGAYLFVLFRFPPSKNRETLLSKSMPQKSFLINIKRNAEGASSIAFLIIFLSVLVVFFGLLTLKLDPLTEITIIAFSASCYWVFKTDHYYQISKPKNKELSSVDWKEAIVKRLEKSQDGEYGKTLTVVCASGGGIQSAGWTTEVLTGLQKHEQFGLDFTKSIGWISAVSGGSVGTMYYLDGFDKIQGCPKDEEELNKIVCNATENSLDATVWGLIYPDFLRFFGLQWLFQAFQPDVIDADRGTAIEDGWARYMKSPESTLQDWSERIKKGDLPIPIFNATLVESGERFLISPMTFGSIFSKGIDFNTLYKHSFDMKITTAARLSSTFPYLSPVARPPHNFQDLSTKDVDTKDINTYHVADGAYFDNYGVTTSLELLDELLENDKERKIKNVLFLQINAFADIPPEKQISKGSWGWLMEVIGPATVLFNVRSSTQTAANSIAIRLLQEKWESIKSGSVIIQHHVIAFPSYDKDFEAYAKNQVNIRKNQTSQKAEKQLRKLLDKGPPLSWKLSFDQKKLIEIAWKYYVEGKNNKGFKKLKEGWDSRKERCNVS